VNPNNETGQPNHLRSQSVTVVPTTRVALSNPAQDLFRRVRSVDIKTFGFSLINTEGLSAPKSNLDADGDSCESDRLSGSSPHQGSDYSSFSSEVAPVPYVGTEGSENGLELSELHQYKEDLHQSSPPSVLVRANIFVGHSH